MLESKPRAAKPKPRRRLDSSTARELILDAAEKRLVGVGPSGIRLQEVAADAGVSHPTVLHHFGSREALVTAVIARALQRINATLIGAIGASSGDEKKLEGMLENVASALGETGHGRVILWLALEGHRIDGAEVRLSDVVGATHALRLARAKERKGDKGKRPTREDTAQAVVLAALALVGGSVLTPVLLENAGLGADPKAATHFRAWLARLLLTHFDGC